MIAQVNKNRASLTRIPRIGINVYLKTPLTADAIGNINLQKTLLSPKLVSDCQSRDSSACDGWDDRKKENNWEKKCMIDIENALKNRENAQQMSIFIGVNLERKWQSTSKEYCWL